jgi:transposase
MGTDRTHSATETTSRWEGSSVARYAGSAQRDLVGLGYRRAVARTAQEISAVPNLPPPLPAVGTGGQTGRHFARASRGIARTRETGTGGGFYRRLLHGGKKGGLALGPTKRGKGTKILALCTDHSLPLAVGIQSASPHESQLVEEVLGQSFLDELPERLIGDAAYDSDPLDDYLLETYDIELIAPHTCNRKRLTQDGRPFRRDRRRWCVERLFAWLHWFRRLVIRWEYHAENFLGMVQLGCIKILLRHI